MRILVACECSGRVREAFRKLGHDAWSCDILPADDNSPYHIQDDVLKHLDDGWDLMVAHPPCTYLSSVGNRHLNAPGRAEARQDAADFFMALVNASIERIAVENPVGYMNTYYRKPDQIIHPYYFGEPFKKRTCLWLNNLPALKWDKDKAVKPEPLFYLATSGKPINWVEGVKGVKDRQKARNTTFQSIADAIGNQWGTL
jgi:hypothetical protein